MNNSDSQLLRRPQRQSLRQLLGRSGAPTQPAQEPAHTPTPAALRSVEEIEGDVLRSYEEHRRAVGLRKDGESIALAKAIENGKFLQEAKDQLEHGRFQNFVKKCGIPLSTANAHMQLYNGQDEIDQWREANPQRARDLSQRQAQRIIKGKGKTQPEAANAKPGVLQSFAAKWENLSPEQRKQFVGDHDREPRDLLEMI